MRVFNVDIDPIVLLGVKASHLWVCYQPTRMSWENDAGPQEFIIPGIPDGLVTDLASVPAMLRWYINSAGPIKEASVGHDALYQYRPVLTTGERITRQEADLWLREACRSVGQLHEDVCDQIYLAVRAGGGRLWHKHDGDFCDDGRLL